VSEIATESAGDPEAVASFVEDFVAYRLPWGVSAYLRILRHINPGIQVSPTTQGFAAMLKYGVPSPEAAWAHAAGVTSRTAAALLGELAVTRGEVTSPGEFRAWLSRQQPELLADELGVSGEALRETARAVLRSRPNPLIAELEAGRLLPRTVSVRLLRRITPSLAARALQPESELEVVRDYDSTINRNSVALALNRLIFGYLPWDLSVALAPEIDAGMRLGARVSSIRATDGTVFVDVVLSLADPNNGSG
jgi:hypothetical protein